MVKEQNQTEEVNGKTERSGEEKVSALTLSLHPGELIFGFFCVFTKQLHVKSVSYHLLLGSSCSAGVIKLCLAEAGVPDGQWQGTVKLLPAHCFSKSKDFFFFFPPFDFWWLLCFCQSPLPTTETESSTDEQEHMQHSPAEESQQSSKRKRTPVDIGSDEDLDIDGIQTITSRLSTSCYSHWKIPMSRQV